MRQMMQKVKQLDGNRTAEFCIAINGPNMWNNLRSIRQFTSGFYAHSEDAPVHSQTVSTVDWRCCDFTVIVAPDSISSSYLLAIVNSQRLLLL